MLLSQLYKNFGKSSPEEQAEFISQYRLRRATDLETTPAVRERKPTTGTVVKKQKRARCIKPKGRYAVRAVVTKT